MFSISEVARRVGVRASTVRFYEERAYFDPQAVELTATASMMRAI